MLYPAAVALPIMSLSTFGHESSGSVASGALELWRGGEVLLALLVGVCSLVLPLLKLTGLLLVSRPPRALSPAARGRILRLVEWTGRWGMLDVLLIAVVAAWLKLGDLVTVEAGPGVWAFTGMVVLSLLASSAFDPHAAWSADQHE
ncbi:MAG: paraquat-inducible protein A [Planctomycetes bacterium]|nr:paraquat-inducible protein A [Planctomycetota bacterium]